MLSRALLLGLSAAPLCLAYCAPILFPLTCAGGRMNIKSSLGRMGAFFLGRLAGYIFFGLILGLIGNEMESPWSRKASALALAFLAVLLMLEGKGESKMGCRAGRGRPWPKRLLLNPVAFGLASGFSPCPPFLTAGAYVLAMADSTKGAAFFAAYFMGTIGFQIPIALLGPAASRQGVRYTAQLTALLAGVVFFFTGIGMLLDG